MHSIVTSIRARHHHCCSLLLLVYLAACASWHQGTPTPEAFIAREQPGRIRVTRTDGSTFILRAPQVSGDSLTGTSDFDRHSHRGVLLSDVREVAIKKTSAVNTLVLVGAILVTIVVVGCSSGGGGDSYGGC